MKPKPQSGERERKPDEAAEQQSCEAVKAVTAGLGSNPRFRAEDKVQGPCLKRIRLRCKATAVRGRNDCVVTRRDELKRIWPDGAFGAS